MWGWISALVACAVLVASFQSEEGKIAALQKQLKSANTAEQVTQQQLADATIRADNAERKVQQVVAAANIEAQMYTQNSDAQDRIADAAEQSAEAQQDLADTAQQQELDADIQRLHEQAAADWRRAMGQ